MAVCHGEEVGGEGEGAEGVSEDGWGCGGTGGKGYGEGNGRLSRNRHVVITSQTY